MAVAGGLGGGLSRLGASLAGRDFDHCNLRIVLSSSLARLCREGGGWPLSSLGLAWCLEGLNLLGSLARNGRAVQGMS